MIIDSNWQAIGASSFLGLPLIIWILLILFLANRIKIIIFTLSGIMSAIACIVKYLKNRNGVAPPCRTTYTVCGGAPCYAFLSIQL